jgi:hypothetical protein
MSSEHATVIKDGYWVPLIGIPMRSTIETCDLCGDDAPIIGRGRGEIRTPIMFTGRQFLCEKCRRQNS